MITITAFKLMEKNKMTMFSLKNCGIICAGLLTWKLVDYLKENAGDPTQMKIVDEPITFSTYKRIAKSFKRLPSKDVPITITLKTEGGCAASTKMIVNLIVNHKGPVTCKVDEYAFSGGTLIALVCDTIKMSQTALLSPIDPILIRGESVYACRDYSTVYKSSLTANGTRSDADDAYLAHHTELIFAEYLAATKKMLLKKHPDEELVTKIQDKFVREVVPHATFYTTEDLREIIPYLVVE